MIDCRQERLLTFNEAAKLLPKASRPNASTWWRWYAKGWRGQRLETVRVGKRRLTSAAAVQRFLDAVTAIEDGHVESRPAKTAVSPAKNAAERFLAAEGILPPAEATPLTPGNTSPGQINGVRFAGRDTAARKQQ